VLKDARWIKQIAKRVLKAARWIKQIAKRVQKDAKWINPNAINPEETNAHVTVVLVRQAENANAQIARIVKANAAKKQNARRTLQAE
jgi:hypothetical protein